MQNLLRRTAILSLFALANTQFGVAAANPLLDTTRTAIEKRISIDSRTDDEPDADRQVTAKIRIIVDTDANNELDDQHAMAYALFNSDVFDVVGVTVNNTPRGDGIQGQYDEAKRILQLCSAWGKVPLLKGADRNFEDIRPQLSSPAYDGAEAVEFIVEHALASGDDRLVLIPIGKLTNIALALERNPSIANNIRIVWLGSNYPDSGEYNLAADPASVNYVIQSAAPFEMVTVRYFQSTGSGAVQTTGDEIKSRMPGQGPRVAPVTGRRGGSFTTFGDYSISLFNEVNHTRRSLFDVVAVAVVKNASWGQLRFIEAPKLNGIEWAPGDMDGREIGIWENFNAEAILTDLFDAVENYRLVE